MHNAWKRYWLKVKEKWILSNHVFWKLIEKHTPLDHYGFYLKIITTEIFYLNPCCLNSVSNCKISNLWSYFATCFQWKITYFHMQNHIYPFVYMHTEFMPETTYPVIIYAKCSGVSTCVKKIKPTKRVFLIHSKIRNTTCQPCLVHSTNQILKLPIFFPPSHQGKYLSLPVCSQIATSPGLWRTANIYKQISRFALLLYRSQHTTHQPFA